MTKTLQAVIAGALLAVAGAASADNLNMDGVQPDGSDARPTRGMTASNVESKFGNPEAKQAAVGEPPIARWEYKDFVVYFEYDRVIHAVARR